MTFKYLTVKDGGSSKINVERSIFIGNVFHIENRSEVEEIIDKIRSEHFKSNHVAWGFVLFNGGKEIELSSDDGEPLHTAGDPILREIRRVNLKNVLVTVVRYFGGKKLGKRGLIDAYSKCASLALESSNFKEVVLTSIFEVVFTYDIFGKLSYEINKYGGVIRNIDYGKMKFLVEVPEEYSLYLKKYFESEFPFLKIKDIKR